MSRYSQLYYDVLYSRYAVFDDAKRLGLTTRFVQLDVPAEVWTIEHQMDSTKFLIEVIDSEQKKITPDSITIVSSDVIEIRFPDPVAGSAYMLFFDSVSPS